MELACVYRLPWIQTLELTQCLDLRGAIIITYDQAEYRLEKIKDHKLLKEAEDLYASSKKIADQMLANARKEEVRLAYRAARNYFFQAVRNLELPDTCGDLLNERMNKKEEAQAIFNVIRKVFETEIHPVDLPYDILGRVFDGVPEDVVDAMYKQENIRNDQEHFDISNMKGNQKDEKI